jgi:hypothetical protein
MNSLPPGYPYPAYWQTAAPPPPVYPTYPQSMAYSVPATYQPTMPVQPPAPVSTTSLLNNQRFIKGALVGAIAAYLLTNDNVQQAVIKSTVKVWSMVQGGVEEMKERFRDAEAELHATEAQAPDPE